jgi:hypothetical protein
MLYRAIGLVLDFIHRLVCGRQKIPQRFGDWICLRPQVDGVQNKPSSSVLNLIIYEVQLKRSNAV